MKSFDTSNIMTFCQIFEVASGVRQKVVDHRTLTIKKCSVQEKKIVGDKRSLMAGSLMTGSTVYIHPKISSCPLIFFQDISRVFSYFHTKYYYPMQGEFSH